MKEGMKHILCQDGFCGSLHSAPKGYKEIFFFLPASLFSLALGLERRTHGELVLISSRKNGSAMALCSETLFASIHKGIKIAEFKRKMCLPVFYKPHTLHIIMGGNGRKLTHLCCIIPGMFQALSFHGPFGGEQFLSKQKKNCTVVQKRCKKTQKKQQNQPSSFCLFFLLFMLLSSSSPQLLTHHTLHS